MSAIAVGLTSVLGFSDVGGVALDRRPADGLAVAGSTPTKIALDHLREVGPRPITATHGLGGDTSRLELVVDATARSEHSRVTHVYVQQRVGGIDVIGANANVAVTDAGVVAHDPNSLLGPPAGSATANDVLLDQVDAAAAVLGALDAAPTEPLTLVGDERGPERRQLVTGGGVAAGDLDVRLVYIPIDKRLELAWEVRVELLRGDHLQIAVAADDGRELRRDDYTIRHTYVPASEAADGRDGTAGSFIGRELPTTADGFVGVDDDSSYQVFTLPIEAPAHGSSSLVSEPADGAASPFGWHDTDGAPGAESTLTTGNNVDAYLDQNADNVADAGSRPDGSAGLDFDVAYDESSAPDESTNSMADVINLFYASNWAHDFLHAYGFDEASGNFQENNYGNGGAGGDRVRAEGLDGYGLATPNTNNANFSTPPDGHDGRMQMYAFTLSDPHRSSSFDNGVILHEYGHGWSVRLTGGRNDVACLNNQEQMGEGWSDFAALIATMQPGDDGADARGIGAWVVGQNANGRGIRDYPYSTDLVIDPRTYDEIRSASVPHGVGSTWAAMLWEMTWALVDAHGFDPDVVHGTGGNNLAMQLVADGLKLQPCSPGFVDGRDAIIQADRLANDGANECLIWGAFAKRGLGWSAAQGSSASRSDGTEAFDLPPFCPIELTVDSPSNVTSLGDVVEVALMADHRGTDVESDVVVAVEVAAGLTVVLGSPECDRSVTVSADTTSVSFDLGDVAPGARIECSYDAEVTGVGVAAGTSFAADFESSLSPLGASHAIGTLDWRRSTSESVTGLASAHATNPSSDDPSVAHDGSDQRLSTLSSVSVEPCSTLSFSHRFDTEATYDGGVVEILPEGGSWTDLGGAMTSGGYDTTIAGASTTDSVITGRAAFSGDSGGFRTTTVDLADHAGDDVDLRFRYVSDFLIGSAGWWIDDVTIAQTAGSSHTARLTTASLTASPITTCVLIDDSSVTTTSEPTTVTTAPPTTPPDTTTTSAPPATTTTTTVPAPTTTGPPTGPPIGGEVETRRLDAAIRMGRQR